MKRGDVIIAAMRGDFTGKPRPYVVVQRETTLHDSVTVTACPLTTGLMGGGRVRIAIAAEEGTGLEQASEIEVDRVTTLRKTNVREIAGVAPSDVMVRVDEALRRWLDL